MSEEQRSTSAEAPRATQTVACEKHGLRYNPALHGGCVRCRREAGEKLGGKRPARKSASGRPAAGGSVGGSVGGAVGVAAALVFVAGLALFWSHQQVYDETVGMWQEGLYDEELTPEEREELEEAQRELQKLFGGEDDD